LTYNIDVDDYLTLLKSRISVMVTLKESKTAEQKRIEKERDTQRDMRVVELLQTSKKRLVDPYSILVNEILTKAMFDLPS
jgi:hypothetical protein